jgi:hypothetical protein
MTPAHYTALAGPSDPEVAGLLGLSGDSDGPILGPTAAVPPPPSCSLPAAIGAQVRIALQARSPGTSGLRSTLFRGPRARAAVSSGPPLTTPAPGLQARLEGESRSSTVARLPSQQPCSDRKGLHRPRHSRAASNRKTETWPPRAHDSDIDQRTGSPGPVRPWRPVRGRAIQSRPAGTRAGRERPRRQLQGPSGRGRVRRPRRTSRTSCHR